MQESDLMELAAELAKMREEQVYRLMENTGNALRPPPPKPHDISIA